MAELPVVIIAIALLSLVLAVEIPWIRRRQFRAKVAGFSKVIPVNYAIKGDPRTQSSEEFGRAVVKPLGPGVIVGLSVDERTLFLVPSKAARRIGFPSYEVPRSEIRNMVLHEKRLTIELPDQRIELLGYLGIQPEIAIVDGPDGVARSDGSWKTSVVPGSFTFAQVFRPYRISGGAVVLGSSVWAIAEHNPYLGWGVLVGGALQLGLIGRLMGRTTFRPQSTAGEKIRIAGLSVSAVTGTVPYAIIGALLLLLAAPFPWVGLFAGITLSLCFSNVLMYLGISKTKQRSARPLAAQEAITSDD